jgi:hypothetical protein
VGELDFDELDKAVNNLMGSVKGEDSDVPQPKVLNISSTLQADEKPEYQKLGEVAKTIGGETWDADREKTVVENSDLSALPDKLPIESVDVPVAPPVATQAPKTPAAPRTANGRFMDVVHPSADMRAPSSPTTLEVPARPVKQETPTTLTAPTATKEPGTESSNNEAASMTPFLPDANEKVEKRPLGSVPSPFPDRLEESASDDKSQPIETGPVNSEYSDDNDKKDQDQQILNPSDFNTELSSQEQALQKIESAEVSEYRTAEESLQDVESADTEKQGSFDEKSGGNIKANDATEPAGAIYDVKDYHQPLSHPAKQKSGWGTIIIIILIIAICITLAAGAYFILGPGA